jgi:DNA-binding NarL/FixJ family response regulator
LVKKSEVVDVLSALASGVHPATGEVFEEASPYNHPQIIRALFGSLELLQGRSSGPKKTLEEINREEGRPLRSNLRWSEEEDQQLIQLIEQGILTGEIATQFERTRGAIHSRLQRQGLLEREELLNRTEEELLQLLQARISSG